MTVTNAFVDFLPAFFAVFTPPSFRGTDFPGYLARPPGQRTGDEASIVDAAVVIPLLGLLGFAPGEQTYNRQKHGDRPDFAPEHALYGTCFVVEDKATALSLDFDMSIPNSHLAQLARYARTGGLRIGLLTNGTTLTAWRFDDPDVPQSLFEFDIAAAVSEWKTGGEAGLTASTVATLRLLFDTFRQAAFTDPDRLEQEVAIDLATWQKQALPLTADSGHETKLVEVVKLLLSEVQRDARRKLQACLERFDTFSYESERVTPQSPQLAADELKALREGVIAALMSLAPILGLNGTESNAVESALMRLEADARAFANTGALLAFVLATINAVRQRGATTGARAARPFQNLNTFTALRDATQKYGDRAFAWHQRRLSLRAEYRADIAVRDDYSVWVTLVQETMLGDMDETAQRDEFALQAAYVVFIRLLLLRVCEDKGIFRNRFISDGGLKHWREDIDRYLQFADGESAYDPLLDMAYLNAKNIYAHFFTERELFNWYRLERPLLLLALHQLSRFDFAQVQSDLLGTIYGTYVDRKEKKKKGQYYTPPAIVRYILDEVGYREENAIASPNRRLIDPACGSGTFLVEAAQRLVAAYRKAGTQTNDPLEVLRRVRNNLVGFDLNPFACYLAEVNLLIQTLDLVKDACDATGKPPRLEPFHIYNVDALARPDHTYYGATFSTLLADELQEVDAIKTRASGTPYANGFAFVVANPPYGAKLTEEYKARLTEDYAEVFSGRVDSYVFFYKLGLELLGPGGKLGFITPNTFLMGVQARPLREQMLLAGRITEIVDLPQGIWRDATVDCALLLLAKEPDAAKREANVVSVRLMGLNDELDKLTDRTWTESLSQPQSAWTDAPNFDFAIRADPLLKQIEEACRVPANGGSDTRIVRLSEVTDSTQGIIPYETEAQGKANLYIKPVKEIPANEPDWKPLLDGESYVGRYELRWDNNKYHLKYGDWLCRGREPRFFEKPKLLVQDMRNHSLQRRLVAMYDDRQFYNRHNYSNIIAKGSEYDLKYILALFNSRLLNYWYARRFDNVHVNPSHFRQLPIYPADTETQAKLVALVDKLLAVHAELNRFREQDYKIDPVCRRVSVPYDRLLQDLLFTNGSVLTLTLFDALASSSVAIAPGADLQATVSSKVYERGDRVVLRFHLFALTVPDAQLRRYLAGFLSRPQWQGQQWDGLKSAVHIPDGDDALTAFFALEAQRITHIENLLDAVTRLDDNIDVRVLDLYGITDAADRARILGSASAQEDDETAANVNATEPDGILTQEKNTA